MRAVTEDFAVNGKPMLAPDMGVQVSYEDIDGASAGRDQSGYMHRRMVRCKVPSWTFTYNHITEEERAYTEALFGSDAVFTFTHPSRLDARQRELLRLRFGMDDGVCRSLQQIGDILGVSKERARQIERQALDRLQELGAGFGLEDFLK